MFVGKYVRWRNLLEGSLWYYNLFYSWIKYALNETILILQQLLCLKALSRNSENERLKPSICLCQEQDSDTWVERLSLPSPQTQSSCRSHSSEYLVFRHVRETKRPVKIAIVRWISKRFKNRSESVLFLSTHVQQGMTTLHVRYCLQGGWAYS